MPAPAHPPRPGSQVPRPWRTDYAPVEVAAGLRHLPGLVFFDSAREGATGLSIVAARPVEVLAGTVERDWDRLAAAVRARTTAAALDDGLPCGFAAGTVGYDGQYHFGIYEEALFYRHETQTWVELGGLSAEVRPADEQARAGEVAPVFSPSLTAEEYCAMVRRAQAYIAAGDFYQVNLAHPFQAPWAGDPWAFYRALREVSPTPYASYLAQGERAVLSSSPELFLQLSGKQVRTRPIKGTRPRRRDAHADEKSAYDLQTSPKEHAELVMITDLERNDLGQVCEWGSVTVPELLTLERHAQVFHLVSTVEGRLRAEVDHLDAFQAAFPGGSITGAPKKRAREIIAELEPYARGLYTGAIGYFGFNGESQFSIAIRTVVAEASALGFHVGAGIVADSKPEAEWQETLDKAAGILAAGARLSETT